MVSGLVTMAASADQLPLPDGVAVLSDEIPPLIVPNTKSMITRETIEEEALRSGPAATANRMESPPQAERVRKMASEPFRLSPHSELLYARKKAGTSRLVLTTPVDSLVKIIDLGTNRLAAMVWMAGDNRAFNVLNLPESTYRILVIQGLSLRTDGAVVYESLWECGPLDLSEPFAIHRAALSIHGPQGLKPADPHLWGKFNPPARR